MLPEGEGARNRGREQREDQQQQEQEQEKGPSVLPPFQHVAPVGECKSKGVRMSARKPNAESSKACSGCQRLNQSIAARMRRGEDTEGASENSRWHTRYKSYIIGTSAMPPLGAPGCGAEVVLHPATIPVSSLQCYINLDNKDAR